MVGGDVAQNALERCRPDGAAVWDDLVALAARDAVHLAVATAIAADYLLTWNCRHLANAQILRRLEREARHAWRLLPQVCTPLELMGDLPYENESST